MKKYFWIGLMGLLLFEIANVYFINPCPAASKWTVSILLISFTNSVGFSEAYFDDYWNTDDTDW